MSGQDDDTSKTYDATPQKLLDARKKGDVAKSTDLLTAASYTGFLVALLMTGADGIRQVGTSLMVLIDQADTLSPLFFAGATQSPMAGMMMPIFTGLAPLFALPATAVIIAVFAQRAWVFAPTKLAPKLSRISILSNAKNKFGRDGLFEWLKSFTKLTLYSIVLALFIQDRLADMVGVLHSSPRLVLKLLAELCITFLFITVLISGAIGAIDALYQHFAHLRKNMMSHKEIADETKNAEGDPHMKQERRQRAMSVSQSQMMADVPKADVVIVNPTHYAVALTWSRQPNAAPVCVAKGIDEIAKAIREAAQEAGVPIRKDPPTARSLHATTTIGDEISPDFYRAVAAAIRFAETMRQRAKEKV